MGNVRALLVAALFFLSSSVTTSSLYHNYQNYHFSKYPEEPPHGYYQPYTKYVIPRSYDGSSGYQTRTTYPTKSYGGGSFSYKQTGYGDNSGSFYDPPKDAGYHHGSGVTYGSYNTKPTYAHSVSYVPTQTYASYPRDLYKSGPGYKPFGYPIHPVSVHLTPDVHKSANVVGYDPYGSNDFQPKKYDPCATLPEGDYGLEGEFQTLFPGVDRQCNFVKCANYKAYVNPCSIGTKNDGYGQPDSDYGFCAYLDTKHYCGHYPPQDNAYMAEKTYKK